LPKSRGSSSENDTTGITVKSTILLKEEIATSPETYFKRKAFTKAPLNGRSKTNDVLRSILV
jgi:hypothetical protein